MRIRVALAFAGLAACTTADQVSTIEHTVDACSPLALVTTAPTELQTAGMNAAQTLWLDRGAPALGRRSGATLEVRFEDAAGNFHGIYDDHERVIYVNRGIDSESVLGIVIAHELGHAFGLQHVPVSERASVMNPGNLSTAPTEADQATIEGLWGSCE